jgi:4-amino-4-deoxy-L-arabinose transferase-like glycosyltransferase
MPYRTAQPKNIARPGPPAPAPRAFEGADALALLVVAAFVGIGLHGLGTVPVVHEDEPWIAAPGYGFWTTGAFATGLFRGLYGSERHFYGFMPLFSLLSGGSLKLFGLGLFQVRLASLASAAAVLLLTHLLGRGLFSARHGLGAVLVLASWPIAVPEPHLATGIPFFDLARLARYDVAVPVFGLLALLALVRPLVSGAPLGRGRLLVSGVFAGLSTLTHVYGAVTLAIALHWAVRWGRRPAGRKPAGTRRLGDAAWLLAGFLAALAPWLVFVAGGFTDFLGQQRAHATRFELLDPRFFVENVLAEAHRYAPLLHGLAGGRPGSWLIVVLAAAGLLLGTGRGKESSADPVRLLRIAVATVVVLFALFLQLKLFTYLSLLWPLLALAAAAAGIAFWSAPFPRLLKATAVALVLLASLHGAGACLRLASQAGATTPYAVAMARLGRGIPPGSRVLTLQHYWLGLAERFPDCRSALVPVSRWDRRDNPRPIPFDAAVEEVPPDVVVLDPWLRGLVEAPVGAPFPAHEVGEELRRYLTARGAERIDAFEDGSYGRFEVYRIPRPPPGPSAPRPPADRPPAERTNNP